MEEQQQTRWQAFRERMRHRYRLVVMTDDSLEEVNTFKLTLNNILMLISVLTVLLVTIVFLLIAFTPIRKYIPGYGDYDLYEQTIEAKDKIAKLEDTVKAQEDYIITVRKMLTGDVETVEDVKEEQSNLKAEADSLEEVKRSAIEEELTQEIDLEKMGHGARERSTSAHSHSHEIEEHSKDKRLEQIHFIAPVNGQVSANFNPEETHYGVDILAPKNTAIKAAAPGYVFLSDWTLETGNTIGIQHTNNMITFYKHNSALLKKEGAFVKAGEAVAIIGNTGTLSSGPHLHFELWYKGIPLNPVQYVSF